MAFVFVPTIPGCVVIVVAVNVTVAGISIVSRPDGKAGRVVMAGVIEPCVIRIRVIIAVTGLVVGITVGGAFARDTAVESVVPSLLVHIVRVETVGVFFKEIRVVASRKAPTVAPLHKPHLVGCWLLYTDHGIHLRHTGGQQRRRTLIPALVMGVTS